MTEALLAPRKSPHIDKARELVPVLRERAEATNKARTVPKETIDDFRSAGLWGLLKPKQYGGHEVPYDEFLEVGMELGRGDGSAAWVFSVTTVHELMLALYPKEAQDDVWGANPEALAASSFEANGKVEPAQGGVKLTGQWRFSSGVDHAEWVLVGAMFGMVGDPPHPDVRWLLVPKSDYEIIDDWHVIGLAGTGSKSIKIEDVFVPDHRMLSFGAATAGKAPGSQVHDNPIYKTGMWAIFPFCLSSPATGIARGAFDAYVEATRARNTAYTNEKVAQFRGVQMRVAEAGALIDAADMLYRRSIREQFGVVYSGGELTTEMRVRGRRDQGYSVLMAQKAAELLFRSSGGGGLYESSHVQRSYRDLMALGSHIATHWDLCAANYGQVVLGGPPADVFF